MHLHDAVYCEGDCKSQMHRKCVSMSKCMYDKVIVGHSLILQMTTFKFISETVFLGLGWEVIAVGFVAVDLMYERFLGLVEGYLMN